MNSINGLVQMVGGLDLYGPCSSFGMGCLPSLLGLWGLDSVYLAVTTTDNRGTCMLTYWRILWFSDRWICFSFTFPPNDSQTLHDCGLVVSLVLCHFNHICLWLTDLIDWLIDWLIDCLIDLDVYQYIVADRCLC